MYSVSGCKAKCAMRKWALASAIRVNPADVHFTQDAGFSTFSDKRWLAQTMYEIVRKKIAPRDLPLLRVCRTSDGRLWSLDNRRLYVLRACGVRSILVEPAGDASACVEFGTKRHGSQNGSTSDGRVLVIKEGVQCGGKKGKASLAAMMPCSKCSRTAATRFRLLKFVKGSKKAILDDCETCERLVNWCKKL